MGAGGGGGCSPIGTVNFTPPAFFCISSHFGPAASVDHRTFGLFRNAQGAASGPVPVPVAVAGGSSISDLLLFLPVGLAEADFVSVSSPLFLPGAGEEGLVEERDAFSDMLLFLPVGLEGIWRRSRVNDLTSVRANRVTTQCTHTELD